MAEESPSKDNDTLAGGSAGGDSSASGVDGRGAADPADLVEPEDPLAEITLEDLRQGVLGLHEVGGVGAVACVASGRGLPLPTALAVLAAWRTPARSTTTMGSVVLDGDAALLRVMTGSEWSAQEVAGLLR